MYSNLCLKFSTILSPLSSDRSQDNQSLVEQSLNPDCTLYSV
jgi:hypothetical protein